MPGSKTAHPIGVEVFRPAHEISTGLKVLVVDDERQVCREMARMLAHCGFTGIALSDAKRVLSTIQESRPDAVALDVALGLTFDGFAICRNLKWRRDTSGLPVIMVSGIATHPIDKDRAREIGAAAYLTKPVSVRALQETLTRVLGAAAALSPAAPKLLGKILVLDDDPEWLGLISAWLTEAGHQVIPCRTAADFIRLVDKEKPDCVLLDFDLREAPAESLCRQLRADYESCKIPIIGHSAHPEARNRMLEFGADEFVEKRASSEDLLHTIAACLRRKRWDSSILVEGDIRLDRLSHKVEWGNVLYRLSDEQFKFLYAMVSRAGSWVSLEELSREMGQEISEGAATQLAHRLRAILPEELHPRIKIIKSGGAYGCLYHQNALPPKPHH